MFHVQPIVRCGRQRTTLGLVLYVPDDEAGLLADSGHQVGDELPRVGPRGLISPLAKLVLHGRHDADTTVMRRAHKMKEVLSQCLLVSLPGRVRDEHSNLIQLKPLGVVQVAFRDRGVVLKPEFSVAIGIGRLVIESSYAAQVLWHTALASHGQGESGNKHCDCTATSLHGSSGRFSNSVRQMLSMLNLALDNSHLVFPINTAARSVSCRAKCPS